MQTFDFVSVLNRIHVVRISFPMECPRHRLYCKLRLALHPPLAIRRCSQRRARVSRYKSAYWKNSYAIVAVIAFGVFARVFTDCIIILFIRRLISFRVTVLHPSYHHNERILYVTPFMHNKNFYLKLINLRSEMFIVVSGDVGVGLLEN